MSLNAIFILAVSIFLPHESQDNLLQENRDLRDKLRRRNDEIKQLKAQQQNEKDSQNHKYSGKEH